MRSPTKRSSEREGSPTVKEEEVARLAYQLFEERGGAHGLDQQDWFMAERIVRQRSRSR
ncbi:MAG: DUF2934 domain-containing protein [Candidatus Omnitrophica bacterium]|nr:DUF2934 domain-containing protein [Candidatus Omnitrophota bacterium]MBI3021717.1 DUF2934 domain-containing protein [Candidatus Omnitrophota bacterium]MBI3083298.1 DUF2934 domain-containing protein [Candidatus Omnitrophota bacterium]